MVLCDGCGDTFKLTDHYEASCCVYHEAKVEKCETCGHVKTIREARYDWGEKCDKHKNDEFGFCYWWCSGACEQDGREHYSTSMDYTR